MIRDRAENDSSLARAQRRFAIGVAVTITTTGVIAFLIASAFIRPMILAFFEPHVANDIIAPMVVDSVESATGQRLSEVRVDYEQDRFAIRAMADTKALVLGPFEMPSPPFMLAFVIISALCCVIGVMSSVVFAMPWMCRLQRVVEAFDAVGVEEKRSSVPVHADDVVGQVTKRFNAMADRVETTLREREELLQAVSHELATPLSRVRLLLSLKRVPASPELVAEVEELEALADELVTYVELESTPLPSHTPIDVASCVESTVEAHREWSRHSVRLRVPVAPILAEMRERDVDRTVSNLLRNAERYATSTMRVELTTEADCIRLVVEDDGPGIEPELRTKVFLPFSRVDTSRDRGTGGVGLGLALVDRIATRYQGRAFVDESPLGGARFTVELQKR